MNKLRLRFEARFALVVVAPLLLLAISVTTLAFLGLRSAAREGDRVSMARQTGEVTLAINSALDELAQSQTGVAIWSPAVVEVRKPKPDWAWVDNNVGTWLNFVFRHQADFILDAGDNPIYGMSNGSRVDPQAFRTIEPGLLTLVEAARGRLNVPANPHERLPHQALNRLTSVRTSPRSIHATDLVSLAGRPAAVSVMRMIPDTPGVVVPGGREPLLVSVRYLDASFTRDLSQVKLISGARVSSRLDLRRGERALRLKSSRTGTVGYFMWRPDLPGSELWRSMAPTAALAVGVLLAVLFILIAGLARMMRKDAHTLSLLNAAHLELTAKEAQAHHLAYHDALTGLPNRALFNNAVDRAIAHMGHAARCSVLLLDLDRFKHVNDTLGHLGGDLLIGQVAERLQSQIGEGDIVARLGGDEFAVLLTGRRSGNDDEAVATAMLAALREPFDVLGTQIHVGVSIGIADYPRCAGDRSELMRKADIAMYRSKAEGRDTFRLFSENMDESAKLRRSIEQDLRSAIASKRGLSVHYQPQMSPSGTDIIGLEALLRWKHPVCGDLSPQLFISVAEETGLIGELGRWVLQEACRVARAWPALSIAVNLSPMQFRTRGFAAEVEAIVCDAGVRPGQIELEVTESILLDDDDVVRGALAQLRAAGFRIALDDFGTGYSSLSYLNKFEVDKIKIDKSFINQLGHTPDAMAIIHAVVTLGHAMALSVTAEGVETSEQRDFLKVAGCNELQGFLFSAAIPEAEIARFIGKPRSTAAA